ncbi:DNA glycosylase superfamily protein [Zea mays]|uniref:DNA glycosylase superfamily protein n=3 Tax=Zea mays TaxID=4577 RepID=A0A1D6I4F4_MAIZE|nr:DNA glycosylase superfamily protein [Zea mays]
MSIGMGQFFPSGYGYGFMCPLGTLPTAIPTCYAAFHDQEWGAPVHDDKKLFEMLTLSGALAEMAWPAILSKRDTFREVFMNFDPLLVAELNEKKFLAPSSPASSLLSQHRLRVVIENARELLKVIDEFGSFDRYCWSFMSGNKPTVGRYRHTREVPLRTAKADAISQDLMRRGFLGVGPTVVYAFMQAVGMANDHLVTCYRFEECCAVESFAASDEGYAGDNGKKPPPAVASDQEAGGEYAVWAGAVRRLGAVDVESRRHLHCDQQRLVAGNSGFTCMLLTLTHE